MDRADDKGADMSQDRGIKDLIKALRVLPTNIQKNVLVGAVRAGTKPIIKRARELVPKETQALKKSIKAKKRRVPKGSTLTHFSVYAGGKVTVAGVKFRPYYAHMIEFGTSSMPPQPFLRPAVEQEATNSIVYVRDYIAKRLPREIAKAKR